MASEPTIGEVHRLLLDLREDQRRILTDHEERLRRVERWVYAIPPTFLFAVASIISAILRQG